MCWLFPWEVPKLLEVYYSGPCLFMALYCLYKNAYFGQEFQLSGSYIQDRNLKQRVEQLPLDIKQIILSKIWKRIEPKKGFAIKRGKLFF